MEIPLEGYIQVAVKYIFNDLLPPEVQEMILAHMIIYKNICGWCNVNVYRKTRCVPFGSMHSKCSEVAVRLIRDGLARKISF